MARIARASVMLASTLLRADLAIGRGFQWTQARLKCAPDAESETAERHLRACKAPEQQLLRMQAACYNRVVRWRTAGVQDFIVEVLAKAHDCSAQ
jgi:hypothetical protein